MIGERAYERDASILLAGWSVLGVPFLALDVGRCLRLFVLFDASALLAIGRPFPCSYVLLAQCHCCSKHGCFLWCIALRCHGIVNTTLSVVHTALMLSNETLSLSLSLSIQHERTRILSPPKTRPFRCPLGVLTALLLLLRVLPCACPPVFSGTSFACTLTNALNQERIAAAGQEAKAQP